MARKAEIILEMTVEDILEILDMSPSTYQRALKSRKLQKELDLGPRTGKYKLVPRYVFLAHLEKERSKLWAKWEQELQDRLKEHDEYYKRQLEKQRKEEDDPF